MGQATGLAVVERSGTAEIREQYRQLVGEGLRGGSLTKRSYRREKDTYNLYLRLERHEMSVLGFLTEEARAIGLPPTNNCAEQAIKPHKVRQRHSGCFRSKETAEQYLVVRAYLRSAVAHELVPLEAIKFALAGKPWRPEI